MEEYEGLTEPGAKGALLRREGLYHSHLIDWTRSRDAGGLDALAAKPLGPKGKSSAEKENDKLRADNERLARELAKSQAVVEIMGNCKGSWKRSPRARRPTPGRGGDLYRVRGAGTVAGYQTGL